MRAATAKAKVYGTATSASVAGVPTRPARRAADDRESRRWRPRRVRRGDGASRPGSRRRPASWCWPTSSPTGAGSGSCRAHRSRRRARRRTAGRRRSSPRRCSGAAAPRRRPPPRASRRRCRATPGCSAFSPASDGTGHALFRLGERGPVLVRSGEEIARDVTLVEVRPDGVRIRDHGEMRDTRPSRAMRRRRGPRPSRAAPGLRLRARRPDTAGPSIG